MRETGGDFCLTDLHRRVESQSAYSCLTARWAREAHLSVYSSGRAAYYAILRHIVAEAGHSSRVLLPSYLCHTMLEPVRAVGLDAVFYRVQEDLSIDTDDLTRLMRTDPSVIVICDYFGFHGSRRVLDDPHLPVTDGDSRLRHQLREPIRRFLDILHIVIEVVDLAAAQHFTQDRQRRQAEWRVFVPGPP